MGASAVAVTINFYMTVTDAFSVALIALVVVSEAVVFFYFIVGKDPSAKV